VIRKGQTYTFLIFLFSLLAKIKKV